MPQAITTTLPGVELVQVGTWLASTGRTTITPEDLQATLDAYHDPQVPRSALRIGHTDPRFDGEPALGWVENLRVEPRVPRDPSTGQPKPGAAAVPTLIGDLRDVPAKLAAIIPKAFRRRSVELAWGLRTAAGKVYRCALTGLALLGVTEPAVNSLADVLARYSAPDVGGAAVTAIELAEGLDDPGAVAALSAARAAVISLASARADWAGLDVALDQLDALAGVRDAPIPHPIGTNVETGARDPSPGGGPPVPQVIGEARLRELLAAEQDVDVEGTLAALRQPGTPAPTAAAPAPAPQPAPAPAPAAPAAPAPAQPAPAAPATPQPAPVAGGTPAPTAAAPAPTPAPAPAAPAPVAPVQPELATAGAAFAAPPGTVLLSAGQFQELQAGAAAGATAAAELARQRREGTLDDAIRQGRIAPAERAAFAAQLERDEAGTIALLAGLAPRFAVSTLGGDTTAANAQDAAYDAWEAATFPELAPAPGAAPAGGQ